MRRVRVLVTDDSLFMRAAIRKALSAEPRIEVVGEARDGREAVLKVTALCPDVVTMDINMPVLDGMAAVREIMARRPTPVVMLSAHTTEGARATFAALEAGAVDFLAKPAGEVSTGMAALGPALIAKVLTAAESHPAVLLPTNPYTSSTVNAAAPAVPRRATIPPTGLGALGLRVVVIAVSTGGPAALGQLLPSLSPKLPLAVLVVQHLPGGFTAALAERLSSLCAVKVREAQGGDAPEPGLVLVAPGDRHLDLGTDGLVRVIDGPEQNGVRPSADVTMRGAARAFGRRAVGVVMTGMGRDGAEGLLAIKRAGGVTLAQDQASSVIWGMPRAAIELGAVDQVVPLAELAEALKKTVA